MKQLSLHFRAHTQQLVAAILLFAAFTAKSDSLPLVGLRADNQGSVAWNVTSAGSEPIATGHTLTWLGNPPAYYYTASAEYSGINPGSPGGSHFEAPANGFPNLVATLAANGLGLSNVFTRFGPMNLGGDSKGVDWDYNPGTTTEWRRYQGGTYELWLQLPGGLEPLVQGSIGPLVMTLRYGVLNDVNDDQIDGQTDPFAVADASVGQSAATIAVAQAILSDVNGRQLRTSFSGLQPTQNSAFAGSGRQGGRFEAQSGILETIDQPTLNIDDAEADEGAGNLVFDVSLSPAANQVVTVDYTFADDSATARSDYTGHNGTLTFQVGQTQKSITYPVADDQEVEINEQMLVSLSNANGAPINKLHGAGVILDNDFPGFPPFDPEFYPFNTPCICTPLSGIYRTNASEIWHMKLLGTAGLLRVAAVSVSTNDPATVEALVYNSTGTLVGSNQVSYTVSELVAAGTQSYTKWVEINITNQPAGDRLRVEVHNLPPTPQTQTHYRLHGAGVRWMSTPSPSFAGFEADPTRWRFLVLSNENLVINYFTNNLPGVAPIDYTLYDPAGNVVLTASNAPIVLANEIVVNNAAPGLWTLQSRAHDHYRISKNSGLDRNIYADWRTGSYSDEKVFVKLDGTNAVSTSYDVVLDRIDTWGGVTNFVHYRAQLTTNGMASFPHVQQGLYRISVNPMSGGISTPAPQFEIMACDHPLTNGFDTFSTGNTNQPPVGPGLFVAGGIVRERMTNVTMHIEIAVTQVSTNHVTFDWYTTDGSAHAGQDYVGKTNSGMIAAGLTNTFVTVDVLPDSVFEAPELFYVNLSNVNGAGIRVPQGPGGILDGFRPDFPGDNDDPLEFPQPAPCVCTPLAGQYITNSPQAWIARAVGGPMSLRLIAHAVNNNDPSTIVAKVYDASGTLIATPSVSYNSTEAASADRFEKFIDVPLGSHAAGDALRIEISLGAGTRPTQTHYRLKLSGTRWVATHSPSFAGFEDDAALWRLRVLPGDAFLNVDFFTADTPTMATAMDYQLYDPAGNLVGASSSLAIVPGDELSVTNPITGVWALRARTTQDHYRIAKTSGADTTLYLGWRGASWGSFTGSINLNGILATNTPFQVDMDYVFSIGGTPIYIPVFGGVVTNGLFGEENTQQGFYRVRVTPLMPGISTPVAQTFVVECGQNPHIIFQTLGGTNAGPAMWVSNASVREGDSNTVQAVFQVLLTPPQGSAASLDFSTMDGTATAGADYTTFNSTVSIPAGATNALISIDVLPDNFFELPETFKLNLSNPSVGTLMTTQAVAIILNDDNPVAPHFQRIQRLLTNGHFRLEFDLGDNGASYEIQVSDNLRQWSTIGVATGAAGIFQFTDPDTTNRIRRFYRATAP
jgi:hypothetical protein